MLGLDLRTIFLAVLALAVARPAYAQNVENTETYAYLMSLPVPVVDGDITDRPYRVIGYIDKGVRKATVFSKPASHAKVMRELWEKGRKMGADAVINAGYGEAKKVAFSGWGTREARGVAIKFLTDAEIAALKPVPQPEREPEPAPVAQAPLRQQPLAPAPSYSVADELAKLVNMRDRGLISEDVYEEAKRALLGQ